MFCTRALKKLRYVRDCSLQVEEGVAGSLVHVWLASSTVVVV